MLNFSSLWTQGRVLGDMIENLKIPAFFLLLAWEKPGTTQHRVYASTAKQDGQEDEKSLLQTVRCFL